MRKVHREKQEESDTVAKGSESLMAQNFASRAPFQLPTRIRPIKLGAKNTSQGTEMPCPTIGSKE